MGVYPSLTETFAMITNVHKASSSSHYENPTIPPFNSLPLYPHLTTIFPTLIKTWQYYPSLFHSPECHYALTFLHPFLINMSSPGVALCPERLTLHSSHCRSQSFLPLNNESSHLFHMTYNLYSLVNFSI